MQIGGHLDGGGYYYTASHMFEVRYNCPVSCDYCPENSNPSCVDSTTFADIYTFDCAAWSADYNSNGVSDCSLDDVITDPSACVDSTDGSTLMDSDGVACEVCPAPRTPAQSRMCMCMCMYVGMCTCPRMCPHPITQCMCTCPRNGPAWVRLCRV